jgi:antitoxin HicB
MANTAHPNHGTSLDEFLKQDGQFEAATATAVKRVIAWQLAEEMKRQHITKKAMAARMKTSRGQLDRVLNPADGNVTLETLQRAAQVVGKSLRVELT